MAHKWLGTTEDYILSQEGDNSKLQIEIKTHKDFVPMFNDAWPKALASIRDLSERDA